MGCATGGLNYEGCDRGDVNSKREVSSFANFSTPGAPGEEPLTIELVSADLTGVGKWRSGCEWKGGGGEE